MKHQQSYISASVDYLTDPSSNKEHKPTHGTSIPCKTVSQIYRDKRQTLKEENKMNGIALFQVDITKMQIACNTCKYNAANLKLTIKVK